MSLKILYLIDDLESSRAGSEQHLLWLLRNVPEPEFEKHFIVFSLLRTSEAVILEHNPVVLGERFGVGTFSWPRRLRFLARWIREHDIDLVQAFSTMGELAAQIAVRLAGRGRVIGNRRDCGYDRRWKYRWIHRLGRFSGIRYIANSEAARQAAFRNDRTPLDSVTVIRNPVSFERVREALAHPVSRDEMSVPADYRNEKWVGMVATVRPIKDYPTLIRAAKPVLEKHPETRFLFIGEQDREHKAELERLANELSVSDRIVWYGPVDNPLRLLPNIDVAVLSTHSESFSNAVLEYAAAARPIVVTDVGGLGEIVEDGKTGFLVPPRDPGVLAEKIVRFLDEPGTGRTLGESAREFVFREYDEEKILGQYLDYYRRTASG